MKILIINGSPRPNGATGQTLQYIHQKLNELDQTLTIEYADLGKYDLKLCSGCLACYKTGSCYIREDGLEELSHKIAGSDGVVLGSPTYASNVSAQFKILIDRGHFVFEQLLRDTACFSVVTYENAGGASCQKVVHDLIRFSGGSVSAQYSKRLNHGSAAIDDNAMALLDKRCKKFLNQAKKASPLTGAKKLMRYFIFNFGLRPHAERNQARYQAVLNNWQVSGYAAAK